MEPSQVELQHTGGDRAQQKVAVESEIPQAGQVAKLVGKLAAQRIQLQTETFQPCKLPQLPRDRARQVIVGKRQVLQAQCIADFRGNGADQTVAGQVQPPQLTQLAQLGRNGSGQPSVAGPQVKALQVRQTGEFRRYETLESVEPHVQSRHASLGIGRHAVPLI